MDRPESDAYAATDRSVLLVENVLAHHGTKGMRWGIRKGRSSSPSHPVSEDHASAEAHSSKAKEGGVKALSNKELQAIITRKNLEKQHRDLVGGGKKFEKGHNKVKKILSALKTLNDINTTVETTTKAVKAASKAASNVR